MGITFEDHAMKILCLKSFSHVDYEWMVKSIADFHLIIDRRLIENSCILLLFYEFYRIKSTILPAPSQIHLTKPSNGQTVVDFIAGYSI